LKRIESFFSISAGEIHFFPGKTAEKREGISGSDKKSKKTVDIPELI